MGQYKQKSTKNSLSPAETCSKDQKFKDNFTSTKPLLEQINEMTVYEMNIYQTLCFMHLCKYGNSPSIFRHIYALKAMNKYTIRSKNVLFKPSCKKNFSKFNVAIELSNLS